MSADGAVHGRLALRPELMAPGSFWHAAAVVAAPGHPLAQVDNERAGMLESAIMQRRFFGFYFFHIPRLAEGTG